MGKNKFVQIASTAYSADLHVIKGKLESEGIQVFLRDENTINTDPLLSDAIGGVKLYVFAEDAKLASAIYKSLHSYAKDEEGNYLRCDNCQQEMLEVFYERDKFIYRLFPFFAPRKYKCDHCGHVQG